MRKFLDDVLILAGCGSILYGTWLVNPIAVWFVAGAMLILAGVLAGVAAGLEGLK